MHSNALDVDKWSASHRDRFTPGVRAHGTHRIGGWMGCRPDMDTVAKREKFHHCLSHELNPCRRTRSLFSILTELLREHNVRTMEAYFKLLK
jgi:hypothetical protein